MGRLGDHVCVPETQASQKVPYCPLGTHKGKLKRIRRIRERDSLRRFQNQGEAEVFTRGSMLYCAGPIIRSQTKAVPGHKAENQTWEVLLVRNTLFAFYFFLFSLFSYFWFYLKIILFICFLLKLKTYTKPKLVTKVRFGTFVTSFSPS